VVAMDLAVGRLQATVALAAGCVWDWAADRLAVQPVALVQAVQASVGLARAVVELAFWLVERPAVRLVLVQPERWELVRPGRLAEPLAVLLAVQQADLVRRAHRAVCVAVVFWADADRLGAHPRVAAVSLYWWLAFIPLIHHACTSSIGPVSTGPIRFWTKH
jgi:hypothetical protein